MKSDKYVYKLNETVTLKVSGANLFYNVNENDLSIQLNNQISNLKPLSNGDYQATYIPNTSGNINVILPGVTEFFGKSFKGESIFQVMPLESITANKTNVAGGEKITITASFNESVQKGVKVDFSGGVLERNMEMKEVEGTNGTKYMLTYTILENMQEGNVDVILRNVIDSKGITYDSYREKDVFIKDILQPPIENIVVSQKEAKIGDYIDITVNFTKPVKSGVMLDFSGALSKRNLELKEVPGSNGMKYSVNYYMDYYIHSDEEGLVNITIKNISDEEGTIYSKYTEENVFTAYAKRPEVEEFTLSHSKAVLGDTIRFIAKFNKPVKANMKLSINEGSWVKDQSMTEVEGSNGTSYYFDYKVTENDNGIISRVDIYQIEDIFGNISQYGDVSFTCEVDGKAPKIVKIDFDKEKYNPGDTASLRLTFDEAVQPTMIAVLLQGENEVQRITLTEVHGTDGKVYEAFFIVPKSLGSIDMKITGIVDIIGNSVNYIKRNAFVIGDFAKEDVNMDGIIGVEDLAEVALR